METTALLCTANRVLAVADKKIIGAPDNLLENITNAVSKVSPLLRYVEAEKMISFAAKESLGIRRTLERLKETIGESKSDNDLKTKMNEISASLDRVGEPLRQVLEGVTMDHQYSASEKGDSLERLGNEVRDAKMVVQSADKIVESSSAVRDHEKKSYGKVKTTERAKRFGIVCGNAKKLLDGIKMIVSAFSISGDAAAENINNARSSVRLRFLLKTFGKNLLEETDSENLGNMRVPEIIFWLLQRLDRAFGSDGTPTVSTTSQIRSWLCILGEALGDAENLLESAMFCITSGGSSRSSHGGGCSCCWHVNINNSNSLHSSSTTVQMPIDQEWDDLWQELKSICVKVDAAVENVRQLGLKDETRELVASNDRTLLEPSSMGFGKTVKVHDLQSMDEVECHPEKFQERNGKSFQGLAIGGVFCFEDPDADWWFFHRDESMAYDLGNCSRHLKVAYNELPSDPKQCLDFCRLFPRGCEFDVQTLIKLWMAQGFIESSSSSHNDDLEEVGYKYFLNLLRRFFFDDVKVDSKRWPAKCKINPSMSPLKCCIGGSISHFISDSDAFPSYECFGVKTRSMLFPTPLPKNRRERGHPDNTDWNWDLLISECRFLRALDMHDFSVEKIPDSIGDLKHLRYLDLSKNENLVELPDSITRLLNLQTLKLSHCLRLKELPTGLKNLVNLRHLEIDGCDSLTSLPQGFGKLINLRTLSQIVLSKDDSKAKAEVEELKLLGKLREVEIKNLRHGMHLCLESMRKIRCLSIEWESQPLTDEHSQSMGTGMGTIQLFPVAEELSINGCYFLNNTFSSTSFPNNLRKLHLKRCENCEVLPSLDNCVNLRILVLDEMLHLEYISENFSEQVCASLVEVWLTELPKLKQWSRDYASHKFSRLSKLVIEDCPKMVSIPLFPTLEEGLVLDSTSWNPFEQTMQLIQGEAASSSSLSPLSKLKNLCIVAIDSFDNSLANKIKWRTLQNLEILKLDFVPKLESLPEELQHVTTLRELHIWRCGVKKIPSWIEKLKVLERLVIRVCPKLKKLPKEIKNMKSLKKLEIEDCQTLLRRCEKKIGADWYKIAGSKKVTWAAFHALQVEFK